MGSRKTADKKPVTEAEEKFEERLEKYEQYQYEPLQDMPELDLSKYGMDVSKYGIDTGQFGIDTSQFGMDTSKYGIDTSKYGIDTSKYDIDTSKFGIDASKYDLDLSKYKQENLLEDMPGMEAHIDAADYATEKFRQGQANIMGTYSGIAGASGIAGLAQELSKQQKDFGREQQVNLGEKAAEARRLGLQEAQRLQGQERQMMIAQDMSRRDIRLAEDRGMRDLDLKQTLGKRDLELQQQMYERDLRLGEDKSARDLRLNEDNWMRQLGLSEAQGARDLRLAEAQSMRDFTMANDQWMRQLGLTEDQTRRNWNYGKEVTMLGVRGEQVAGARGLYASQTAADAQRAAGQMGALGAIGGAAIGTKAGFICVPKGTDIDCVNKAIAIEDIKPGDIVIGYNGDPVKVLQKHEYLEDPTVKRFYKVKFDNGSIVDVCDMHRIKGERAMDITESVVSKDIYDGVEFSYDLLTEDAGYRIDGIPVNSMIPELAIATSKEIVKLKNK